MSLINYIFTDDVTVKAKGAVSTYKERFRKYFKLDDLKFDVVTKKVDMTITKENTLKLIGKHKFNNY